MLPACRVGFYSFIRNSFEHINHLFSVSKPWFLRRFMPHLTRYLSKVRVRSDLKRLKNRLLVPSIQSSNTLVLRWSPSITHGYALGWKDAYFYCIYYMLLLCARTSNGDSCEYKSNLASVQTLVCEPLRTRTNLSDIRPNSSALKLRVGNFHVTCPFRLFRQKSITKTFRSSAPVTSC